MWYTLLITIHLHHFNIFWNNCNECSTNLWLVAVKWLIKLVKNWVYDYIKHYYKNINGSSIIFKKVDMHSCLEKVI